VSSDELLRYFSWICRIAAALFLAALLLSGHASAAVDAASAAPDAAAQSAARELYTSTCVSCHGAAGNGDGLAAVGLPAKPANFSDAAWQKRTSDQEIERAIVGGGAAVGKSPLMPANPNLASKPEVVAALRGMIRGFAHDPGQPR
jgi:mono/diheme cytochrome c family protein